MVDLDVLMIDSSGVIDKRHISFNNSSKSELK